MSNRLLSLLAIFAFASFTTLAAQDLVLLANGQRLKGVIDESAETRPGYVAIKTDDGVLRVRQDLVQGIDLGYETRRKQVADDDFAGLFALAQWCVLKDMKPQALELLQIAIALPAATLQAKALHATLVDEIRGPEAALPLYKNYRAAKGADEGILKRLAELEKVKKDYEAKYRDGATPEPERAVAVSDGMEIRGWEAEAPQWSNPIEAKSVAVNTRDGLNRVLQVDFKGVDAAKKAAIRRVLHLPIQDRTVLSVWVLNRSEKPLKLALGVKTGQWVFHESLQQTVPKDSEWHQLRFDLSGKDYKSEATGWQYSGPIKSLDDVKELQFLIFNGRESGTVLLDAIDLLNKKSL